MKATRGHRRVLLLCSLGCLIAALAMAVLAPGSQLPDAAPATVTSLYVLLLLAYLLGEKRLRR